MALVTVRPLRTELIAHAVKLVGADFTPVAVYMGHTPRWAATILFRADGSGVGYAFQPSPGTTVKLYKAEFSAGTFDSTADSFEVNLEVIVGHA